MGLLSGQARRDTNAGGHYAAQLFRGAMTQAMYDRALNEQHDNGYRLSHIYEISGTTVMIFERREGQTPRAV